MDFDAQEEWVDMTLSKLEVHQWVEGLKLLEKRIRVPYTNERDRLMGMSIRRKIEGLTALLASKA